MKLLVATLLWFWQVAEVISFAVAPPTALKSLTVSNRCTFVVVGAAPEGDEKTSEESVVADVDAIEFSSDEEKEGAVASLVADDEWNGLSMELSELVRMSIVEDIKKNAREFLGKDDYKVGDISKEIDTRVKSEVAKLRGKDEYEVSRLIARPRKATQGFFQLILLSFLVWLSTGIDLAGRLCACR